MIKGGGSRCDEAKYCGIQLYDSMSVMMCVCVFVCVCVCVCVCVSAMYGSKHTMHEQLNMNCTENVTVTSKKHTLKGTL